MTELLQRTVDIFEQDDNIKLIVLEGSQVSGKPTDILSDHDINVYGTDFDKYIDSNEWIYKIGKPLIYQKPDFFIEGERIYSRLIVFYNRERIDISFWDMKFLDRIISERKLPESYRNGYKILFGRDGISYRLPAPDNKGFKVEKPSRDEFLRTVNDIWYEAYAIAKYLRRGSLWFAKDVATGPVKEFIRQLLIWDICSQTEWGRCDIHLEGKNLDKFLDYETAENIKSVFSFPYSIEETWTSLFNMLDLAETLYMNIAGHLNIELPSEKLEDIRKFIHDIKELKGTDRWNPEWEK